MVKTIWTGLGRSARIGLISGVIMIIACVLALAIWIFHTDYQVLFSDLTPQDASAMVAELDKMKVPYQLAENGTAILVDRNSVHKVRIKLLGKDLPLHGTVGFELFNNVDFGMTEFAQKVNYQRALQGEITRTILSLSEIHSARVHLALPEEGLFKRANVRPKASVTLAVKPGESLHPEQIAGIQRLVSASVAGIARQDVTIVDEHGVALTHIAQGDTDGELGSSRLDLKKETENYLARKVGQVLDRTFGAGQAMASVDVILDMDQVRVTTEEVVAPPGRDGQAMSGVIVRERNVMRDNTPPLDRKNGDAELLRSNGSSQREVEYQVGKRVEQIISTPGSVKRINVVTVVRNPLDENQLAKIRDVVAAAVGAVRDRGDTVVVQSLDVLSPAPSSVSLDLGKSMHDNAMDKKMDGPSDEIVKGLSPMIVSFSLAIIALVVLAIFVLFRRGLGRNVQPLSESERELTLAQIREWMKKSPNDSDMRVKGDRL
jgi:flagellar M-ring protein FliF